MAEWEGVGCCVCLLKVDLHSMHLRTYPPSSSSFKDLSDGCCIRKLL